MGHGRRGRNSSCSTHHKVRLVMDPSPSSSSNGDYIHHPVSKLDTLAGLAIKYGVEVADIKRLNGLTTDLQMYARKSLRIPLHGKHPPSDSSNAHFNAESQPRLGKHSYSTVLTSPKDDHGDGKRKMSSAIGLLRGYYGLAGQQSRNEAEGTEMEVYKENADYHSEDEPFTPRDISSTRLKPSDQEQSGGGGGGGSTFNNMVSMARDFVVGEFEKAAVRRRPKAEYATGDDKQDVTSEKMSTGKNGIPRPKSSASASSSSRFGVEVEVDCPTVRAVVFNSSRDSGGGSGGKSLLSGKVVEELIFKLKKSPSTPSLQDVKPLIHRNGSKGDLAVLNAGPANQSMTIPLLESLTRRSKAALD